MTEPDQKDPPPKTALDAARAQRRSLADGPAVREALALADGTTKSVGPQPAKPTLTPEQRLAGVAALAKSIASTAALARKQVAIQPNPSSAVVAPAVASANVASPAPAMPPPPRRAPSGSNLNLTKPLSVAPTRKITPAPAAPPKVAVAPTAETVVAPTPEAVVAPLPEAAVTAPPEVVVAPLPEAVVAPLPEAAVAAALEGPQQPALTFTPVAAISLESNEATPPAVLLAAPSSFEAKGGPTERIGAAALANPAEPDMSDLADYPLPVRRGGRLRYVLPAITGLVVCAALSFTLVRWLRSGPRAPVPATTRVVAPAALPPAVPAPGPSTGTAADVPRLPPAPAAASSEVPTAAPVAPPADSARTETEPPWLDATETPPASCEQLVAATPGAKNIGADQAVSNAQRALLRGDTQGAYSGFCLARVLGAQTPMVLMGLAQAQLTQGDLSGALQTVEQRLRYEPRNAASLDLRGDVLVRLGKIQEAQQAWFEAAGATHGSAMLISNLLRANKEFAQVALRGGDLPRAERLLRRAVAFAPTDAAICLQLADVLEKAGRAPAAARWRSYARALPS